ncbi:MAG: hypothetical protein ABJC89_01650 [Acidobacteriota bacterium]
MPLAVDDSVFDLARFEEVFPSTVTITRTSEADFKSRQLIVWLDGTRVAELLWGDSITCELPPGPHRMRVSNTLVWKNVDFTLGPGEQAFFEAINRMGPGSIFLVALLGVGPLYLTINRMC